jgi:hypothetical protein
MSDEIEIQLANQETSFLIAPAGYGKTELIAKAVAANEEGKELVLTHTHAGVRSLRDRLKRLGVSPSRYNVDTIASWSLKLAASYPKLSNIPNVQPQGNEWKETYTAAANALAYDNIHTIIEHSYRGVYVDEYQDCTQSQHELILTLKKLLPVRVLGDPLQGIFGFDDDPLIDWEVDVYPHFEELDQLKEPWRWKEVNPDLGAWLEDVRTALIAGEEIDLRRSPRRSVTWIRADQNAARNACFAASRLNGSVVAIQKWPNQAHSLASQLRGVYTSMEEVECRDLLRWAHALDQAGAYERAAIVIDGASLCWTGMRGELRNIHDAFAAGRIPRSRKYPQIVESLVNVIQNPDDHSPILSSLEHCRTAGDILYRQELWREMRRALEAFHLGEFASLEDAAWHIRNQARREGRRLAPRIVSRTLLIKGLEFDHTVVADADSLDDPKNLYVALTRSARSLAIVANSPIIRRPPL